MDFTEEELKVLRELIATAKDHDSKEGSQDPKAGEEDTSHDPAEGEDKDGKTVNAHKYERDIANRDRRIKELEAKLAERDEADKTDSEKLAELQKAQQDLVRQLETEKLTSKLTGAGCINAKAAMALLDDYEGDIDKLKEANGYLFRQDKPAPTITTGGGRKPSDDGEALTIADAFK